MPGLDRELTADEFFNELVGHLSVVAGVSNAIGFCFSYPAEISPNCDGRLLYWTKEVKAPQVVGQYIGANMAARMQAGSGRKTITILNDTIATLLAGKSAGRTRQYESFVGFILGTGTNTAYIERNANITKRHDLEPAGAQPINVESGNFGRCPRGDLDEAFDRTTLQPGHHTFEKMISGGYLGGLALHVLKAAADEGVLLAPAGDVVRGLAELSTIDMDKFAANPFGPGPLADHAIAATDRARMLRLCFALAERASLLAAVNISAAVLKSGAGKNPLHPVCVNIDGSTFYKTYRMKSLVEGHLRRILGARGVYVDLIHVEEAPLIGAAVAGLTR